MEEVLTEPSSNTVVTVAEATDAATSGLPQLNLASWPGQIFWLIVTFALLYFVLSRFILPRLGQGISNRSDLIADDLDMASRMQREAAAAENDYDQALADARAKAHNIAETTRKSVDADIQSEIDEAEAVLARQQDRAESRIADLRKAAMSKVDDVASDITQDIVQAIAGKSVTSAKVKSTLSSL